MNKTIIHRGPDDSGIWHEGPVGLAMRRLSIIDLHNGAQPVWNEDRSICAVYNGEIYNYEALTKTLTDKNHKFTSKCDSEVLVHLYETYGYEMLQYLKGMFAFALWDKKKKIFFAARDRFGIKPFFYSTTNGDLLFGSEIKCLLAGGVNRTIAPRAIEQYFSHFYIPVPDTIFSAVHKLNPGHYLLAADGQLHEKEYWDIKYEPDKSSARNSREYAELLREHLTRAVSRHMRSDVPVGAFLSGGLDSAAVVAEMTRLTLKPVRTFTVGFPESSYDERPYARRVAGLFKTRHSEVSIAIKWEQFLIDFIRCFDEPYGDYGAVAGFFAAAEASREVKVVLSGDGGDEVLAGYPTHYIHKISRMYRLLPEYLRKKIIQPLVQKIPSSFDRISYDYVLKRFVTGANLPFEQGHFHWKAIFSDQEKKKLFSSDFLNSGETAVSGDELFERYFSKVRHLDPLHQLLYVDAKTFLLDDNLTRVDRISMAHSLEVRVPFLDDDLFDFLRRIPDSVKLPYFTTKPLLREALRDKLPDDIRLGKKKGFTPPMPYWLNNELHDIMHTLLSSQSLAKTGIFNKEYIAQLIEEHTSMKCDHNRKIWSIMAYILWQNEYCT